MMIEMVKQDIKEGILLDWGSCLGELKGYAVAKSDPVDLGKNLQRYAPYVVFEVRQVLSVDETMEIAQSLTQ